MSRFSVLPAAAVLDTRLSLRELSVLAAIGLHTDRNGWCFPSSERLGEILGVSGQMVRRSMAALEEAGYLHTIPRFAEDGGRLSNRVRVLFDTQHPASALRMAPPATSEVATPATSEVATPATSEVAVTVPLNVPKERKKQSTQPTAALVDLPEWVPVDAWEAWMEVRRRKRAANTAHALGLAIRELDKLRAAGNDPRAVLEQSTLRSWTGLFPLKNNNPQSQSNDPADPFQRRRGESLVEYSQRVNRIHDEREAAQYAATRA